jgi:hypothetical protein
MYTETLYAWNARSCHYLVIVCKFDLMTHPKHWKWSRMFWVVDTATVIRKRLVCKLMSCGPFRMLGDIHFPTSYSNVTSVLNLELITKQQHRFVFCSFLILPLTEVSKQTDLYVRYNSYRLIHWQKLHQNESLENDVCVSAWLPERLCVPLTFGRHSFSISVQTELSLKFSGPSRQLA